MSGIAVFAALVLLGVLVALDERGLFAGIVRTPVLVGLLAGAISGHAALGLAVGLVFALVWPVPFRSGGHRTVSPGIAALVGAGAVALAAGSGADREVVVRTESSLAELLRSSGNGPVALAVVFGGLGSALHKRAELVLRRRLTARPSPGGDDALRLRALREVLVLGALLGALAWSLGQGASALGLMARVAAAGWDGGAWVWVLVAALLGGASQLGRARGQRAALAEWAIGLASGVGGGLVLGGVF